MWCEQQKYPKFLSGFTASRCCINWNWHFSVEVSGLCILGRLWKLNPTKMMVIVSWFGRWSMTLPVYNWKSWNKDMQQWIWFGSLKLQMPCPEDRRCLSSSLVNVLASSRVSNFRVYPHRGGKRETSYIHVHTTESERASSPWSLFYHPHLAGWSGTCLCQQQRFQLVPNSLQHLLVKVGRDGSTDGWMFCLRPVGGASSPGTTPWSWLSQA